LKTQTALETQECSHRLRGIGLFSVIVTLILTLLLEALDQTVVGTAMPKIVSSLHGFDLYTWVVNAYLLGAITMIPIVGKLSDQFGRKRFLLAGTAIFLLGSVLAGASQTMDQLIIFRAIQGCGSGIGMALVGTVIADIFPPAERVKWQGIFGGVYGFSSLIGPSVGGWLADHGPLLEPLVSESTRWRWVFYINFPLGIVALAALLICLPPDISVHSNRLTGWAAMRRIDLVGSLLVAAATICLLLGLTWGSDQSIGWHTPLVIAMLVAAGMLYICFFIAEQFAIEPILPLSLFRNRVFAADSTLSLLLGMILMGLAIYLPFFFQGVLGLSATNTGLEMMALLVSIIVGAVLFGGVVAWSKRYQVAMILGTSIMTLGTFLLTRMTPATNLLDAAISMSITGIGIGSLFPVLTIVAQNALLPTQLGVGTGAVNYLRQLGQTLGVAIIGAMVHFSLASDISKRLPSALVKQIAPADLKAATDPQILINPVYRDTIVRKSQHFAANNALVHVPASPRYDQIASVVTAQAMQQTQNNLNQVFEALKPALAVALRDGFIAVLVFSIGAMLATFFLKDISMTEAETNPDLFEPVAENTRTLLQSLQTVP
jgi:EmrB/QacA subfamily drug resistance transporter